MKHIKTTGVCYVILYLLIFSVCVGYADDQAWQKEDFIALWNRFRQAMIEGDLETFQQLMLPVIPGQTLTQEQFAQAKDYLLEGFPDLATVNFLKFDRDDQKAIFVLQTYLDDPNYISLDAYRFVLTADGWKILGSATGATFPKAGAEEDQQRIAQELQASPDLQLGFVMPTFPGIADKGSDTAQQTASGKAEIECSEYFGCTIRNGFNAEFIEQIRKEGNLQEEELELENISSADLIAFVQALKDDIVALYLNSENMTDITPLAELTQLRALRLMLFSLQDCSPLAKLTQLKELTIDFGQCSDVVFLQSLNELEELSLRLLPAEETSFSEFVAPPKLKRLVLAPNTQVEDLTFLEHAPHLEDLGLVGLERAQQWEVLTKLTNLKELDVRDSNFSDLRVLSQMAQLNSLELDRTTITHPEVLAALPNLETLYIDNTQGIDDLSILRPAPKLTTLFIGNEQFPPAQIEALQTTNPNLEIYAGFTLLPSKNSLAAQAQPTPLSETTQAVQPSPEQEVVLALLQKVLGAALFAFDQALIEDNLVFTLTLPAVIYADVTDGTEIVAAKFRPGYEKLQPDTAAREAQFVLKELPLEHNTYQVGAFRIIMSVEFSQESGIRPQSKALFETIGKMLNEALFNFDSPSIENYLELVITLPAVVYADVTSEGGDFAVTKFRPGYEDALAQAEKGAPNLVINITPLEYTDVKVGELRVVFASQ